MLKIKWKKWIGFIAWFFHIYTWIAAFGWILIIDVILIYIPFICTNPISNFLLTILFIFMIIVIFRNM